MILETNEELVSGLNAVLQIIVTRPKSVHSLFLGNEPNTRVKSVIKEAEKSKITIHKENSDFFDENFKDVNHQNIAIKCNKRSEESEQFLHTIIDRTELKILILDGISDPHNLGACLRSAAASDVDAVIVRNKTQLNEELLIQAKNLCFVGRLGVGLDNINTDFCSSNNIKVQPATGMNADSVAEYVISLSLIHI